MANPNHLKLTRAVGLRIVFGVLVGIVVVNLFVIQVVRHQAYVERARSEHMKQFTIRAKRGQIYAMDGDERVPIVMNRQVWTVFLDPMSVGNADLYKEKLSSVLGDSVRAIIDKGMEDRSSRYYVIAREVEREKAEAIKAFEFAGVGLTLETRRAYVEEGMAGQLLGFVNNEGVGQYGVEGGFNEVLSGTDGFMNTVTDVNLIPLSVGDENVAEPAVDGRDVTLSIDRNVQVGVERALKAGVEKLGADSGSAIVIDANDGRIVAMANWPTYNPADYRLVEDAKVFQNSVVQDPYEPASVIKTFTFATGIDIGTMNATQTFTNKASITVNGWPVKNYVPGYHGTMTMQEALNRSMNVGSVTALMRFDGDGTRITKKSKDILYNYYTERFGFGRPTGIGIFANDGIVISPDDEEGGDVRYANMTFGQGMTANMLQVATAFAAVVNGGTYHAAYLDMDAERAAGYEAIKSSTSLQMREMLRNTWTFLNRGSRNKVPKDVVIGGKSGTAEVADLVNGGYKENEAIGSFIGYVGATIDKPEYVVMVRVGGEEKVYEGWTHVSPIFSDIVNYMVKYKGIKG